MELLRNTFGRAHIQTRLDGQHHAGTQDAAGAILDGFAAERVFALADLAHLGRFHIAAAIVHIHAQPVAGAVHIELKVVAVGNHVLRAAHLVLVEQAQVQQPLRQYFNRGVVRIDKARAGLRCRHSSFLRGQHQVIQGTLWPGESAVGGEGAGDVAGVTIELAASIDQHQLAIANQALVGPVMQHAGIRAPRHDGAIRRVLRAVLTKLMQQFGVEVVFAHLLPGAQHGRTALHRANMRMRTDARGTAHDVQLVRIFDEAHFIEQGTHITLLVRTQGAKTHTGTHRLQPAFNAAFQARMRGKGKPDGAAVFQQLGQLRIQFAHGHGALHTQGCGSRIWPQTDTVPDFAFGVLGLAKQRGLTLVCQHQPGVGLGETGEVIKVAVVPEQKVAVAVALLLARSGNDGDAAGTQLGGQAGTALGIESCVAHMKAIVGALKC